MSKAKILWLALFLGGSGPAFAKTGVADGGFELMLAVIGVLLLLAGLFAGVEYLIKDRGHLRHKLRVLIKRKSPLHRNAG
ncbi:MAG TPA: hypothetical protein P5550_10010 [Bacteroidales bacterium]|nr:hypothetical protein [Bacteroidales bacterium]